MILLLVDVESREKPGGSIVILNSDNIVDSGFSTQVVIF